MAEITRTLAANVSKQFFFVITTAASTRCLDQNFQLICYSQRVNASKFKKILACSVSCRVIVIARFSCLCLKDQLGLCSLICHIHTMTGNCSASQRVLANSLRVVSAKRGNPPLLKQLIMSVMVTIDQNSHVSKVTGFDTLIPIIN